MSDNNNMNNNALNMNQNQQMAPPNINANTNMNINNQNNNNQNNQQNQNNQNNQNNQQNQPQKKPSASAIDKKERKQLWQSLAKYCDELIEETQKNGLTPTHRFVHPQAMIDNFIKLGLRPPNNPRGLEKFYDNFIRRCNYLADKQTKKSVWTPKGMFFLFNSN